MEESFHVPSVAKSEKIGTVICLIVILIVQFLVFPIGFLFLPFVAGLAYAYWRCLRLAPRGLLLDGEGLGPAENGERLWVLPWNDFGGYRYAKTTVWERIRRPEQGGYEILDRSGQPVFHYIPPQGGATTLNLVRAAREELDRYAREKAPPPARQIDAPPKLRNVAISLVVAAVGLGLTFAGLAHPQSSLSAWGALGSLELVGGISAATIEAMSLRRRAKGWIPISALPSPEEGPTVARHLAKYGKDPIPFEEGGRYRVVDPERRRRELKEKVLFSYSYLIGILLVVMSLAGLVTEPKSWPILVLSALWWSSITVFAYASGQAERGLLAAVDDVLWINEGHLVVVRAGHEPMVFEIPTFDKARALRRRSNLEMTEMLRNTSGQRYYLDRTLLYEAPRELED